MVVRRVTNKDDNDKDLFIFITASKYAIIVDNFFLIYKSWLSEQLLQFIEYFIPYSHRKIDKPIIFSTFCWIFKKVPVELKNCE
jgi:hypothetical protein